MSASLHVGGATAGMMADGLTLTLSADVDGSPLSAADIAALAAGARGTLTHTSRGWMATPANIDDLVQLAALARKADVTAADIVHADLGSDVQLTVDVSGWVGDVLRGVPPLVQVGAAALPEPFDVVLRDYQKEGVAWLNWCETNQVGGILADHMGLGKTVQLLAQICSDHSGPTLVVAPASLLDNWAAEVEKFAPELSVATFHGPYRNLRAAMNSDIVLTTYALLSRDRSVTTVEWHRVILDEAQAVKNPQTKVAKAVARLCSARRFAVTGTPVENHVGDLWALFNFAQPGLLGSFASFRRRYITGADAQSNARLAQLTSPFILRRLKSDDGVAPELPGKHTRTRSVGLTRAQVGTYEAITDRLAGLDSAGSGVGRRGAILSALTKLKQTCVHDQLADGSFRAGLVRSSGKVDDVTTIVSEAANNGEAVLVFSQFASFLPALASWLEAATGLRVATLDGSMSRQARTGTVAAFNDSSGPDVLAVSLKAGGVGLNLVRANHVVHLDRWWNPATEDQASDRAWRIGQTREVIVHNLVCAGTLEERIDELLTMKRATSDAVLDSSAVTSAVTEMSNEELAAFVGYARTL